MLPTPPFHPYGIAHFLVIFLTIALPFALAALVRWTKSSLTERVIVGALSLTLVLNYFIYLSLVRQYGAVSWEQVLPLQLCDWAMVVIIIGIIFLMLTHHLRPRAFSIVRVFLWTELYFIVTLAADKLTGFNYGFLLHKPEAKTLLNILSDYRPLYLFEMHLLALAFFVVLYLPFAIYDFARRKIRHA